MPRIIQVVAMLLVASLFSCRTSKQLAYLQDLSDTTRIQQVRIAAASPILLQPDDQIQVSISSLVPEATTLFNMMGTAITTGTNSQILQNVYTVTKDGNVTLAVVGDVHIAGLSIEEAKEKIKSVVVEYLKDAVVNVSLMNFRITVIGEVTKPSTLQVAGEKINVLEALGLAGDLTVYGKRTTVKVIRKAGDKVEVGHLNLNNSKMMRSPFYNLKQNDIVYVEPVRRKGLLAETSMGILPTVLSLASVVILAIRFL